MDMEAGVPPGFRFHPTEEELVGYYLKRKVNSLKIDLNVIVDIDLYRMEPWDIQDKCRLGYEEQNEWYFFSHKDRKYPTGTRTNRATAAGFWKATGRDKAVVSKDRIIGMRKTLVFYRGRAPNGRKSDWIMHEYRLQTSEHGPPQEEGWAVCRAFKKPTPSHKQGYEAWATTYNRLPSIADVSSSPMRAVHEINQRTNSNFQQFPFASEQALMSNPTDFETPLLELPQLDSPSISTSLATKEGFGQSRTTNENLQDDNSNNYGYQYSDWKVFDKLISSNAVQPLSYACQNFPLLPADHDLNAENHESHLLGCFSDL